jgi:hypothetical protein
MTQFENWGDYFWPDQIDDCKINKLGIRDQGVLEQVERSRSAERAIEIIAGDVAIAPMTWRTFGRFTGSCSRMSTTGPASFE